MSTGNNHLVHTFLQCFSKRELAQLHAKMVRRSTVRYEEFENLLHSIIPGFCLPSCATKTSEGAARRIRKSIGGDRMMQRALLKELFMQIDTSNEGVLRWSDFSSLVIEMSSLQKPKPVQIFSDVPCEPVFEKREEKGTSVLYKETKPSEQLGPIGRKTHGVGLYWEEVESLRYFPSMGVYCLTGNRETYLFNLDTSTGKATIVNKLRGPTAAVFNINHFPGPQRVLACCADRYIYSWSDVFDMWTATEKVKVHTPQMCMAVNSAGNLLMTGGTDGDVLFFTVGTKLAPLRRIECSTEWLCDLLYLDELAQLVTCTADGKVSAWDVEWDPQNDDLTFQVRTVKDAHERSIKTQVAYSPKGRMLFSIGYGHDVLCWNPFIVSQTHTLCGHDKLLAQIHTFPKSYEVVSGDISGKVIVWDARTLAPLQALGGLDGHSPIGMLNAFTFGRDNNHLVTVGKKFCVFTRMYRDELFSFELPMVQVLFSDSQGCIITISKSRVFVWHAVSGELQATYPSFSNSDLSCAAIVKGRDLAIATVGGEVRFISLLNGAWYRELQCYDAVVHISVITQPTSHSRQLAHKGGLDSEDDLLMLVTTAKGRLSLYAIGRSGCHTELFSWRTFLYTVALSTSPSTGAYTAVASKRDCEVWSTWKQSLIRSIRCSSTITAAVFITSVQAFTLAESAGVLHFYSYPNFAYLMRFTFVDYMVPVSLVYVESRHQLVCTSAACIKVLSMKNILLQYQEHCHTHMGQEAEAMLFDRYALLQRGARMIPGYDKVARSRVMCSPFNSKEEQMLEAQLLREMCAAVEVIDIYESLGAAVDGVYYNILEAFDIMLVDYINGGHCTKRHDGISEQQCIMSGIALGLSALHAKGVVVLLNPHKVGRVCGTWKIVDMTAAGMTEEACLSLPVVVNLDNLDWVLCPPEWGAIKVQHEEADYSPMADIWGLGLVVWFVYAKSMLWSAEPVATVADKLKVYDVPHRQRVLPSALLLDGPMHELLDGTLVKLDRRWTADKVVAYLESCEYLATDTFDVPPFPNSEECLEILRLSERGRYRLTRVNSEPPPRSNFADMKPSESWLQKATQDAPDYSSFVVCTAEPLKGAFTSSCIAPSFGCIVSTEWTGSHAIVSCTDLVTGGSHGWLPSKVTVNELGLRGMEGSSVWDLVPAEKGGKMPRGVFKRMRKLNIIRRLRRTNVEEKTRQAVGTDNLSPFYSAFTTCCDSVSLLQPFYLRGKYNVKVANKLDKKKRAQDGDQQEELVHGKKLGLDFLLATPESKGKQEGVSGEAKRRAAMRKLCKTYSFTDSALFVNPISMRDKQDFQRANTILHGLPQLRKRGVSIPKQPPVQ